MKAMIDTRGPAIRRAISRPRARRGGAERLLRVAVFGLFLVTLALSVYLVKWSVATIPVRAILAILILCLVATDNVEIVFGEMRRFRFALVITIAVALVGLLSSLAGDADLGVIGRQILEIHVQALINVIVGACVVRICGIGRSVFALAVVVAVSSLFALLQFLGFGFAYQVRNFLESLQPAGFDDGSIAHFAMGGRARGLSYTPVHLGTQLCLLFAAVFGFLLHRYGRGILERLDVRVLAAAAFVGVVSVVSGNRSPLLGVILFLAAYAWVLESKLSALVFTLFALVVVLFTDQLLLALQDLGLRVGNTEDGSAVGRVVLQIYGVLLFLGQPFGYGLGFNSPDYTNDYWGYLSGFENAEAITKHALHNYYLLMLNKYGVLILIIAFIVGRKLIKHGLVMLAFVPYMVHIFYHNDGPYQADFLIWFMIPLFHRIAAVGRRGSSVPRRSGTDPCAVRY